MTSDQQSPSSKSGLSSFWTELKRRKVMRVAITYAVVAWLIMQVAGLTFEGFGVPIWAFRFVVIVLWLFFPVALIIAWAFELTPDGIKTTKAARTNALGAEEHETHTKKRNWLAIGFAAAMPTVIFGALALFFYIRLGDLTQETVGEKSIAVLPLENMSPDPANAFFADGVQEDILSNLSKVSELLVIGRTSTLQYRDTVKTLKQIGSELGVRYLVQGTVRRASNQVRVSVQLIDAETEGQIWDVNYNRTLDDIFAIQAEVAKEIASQLRTVLTPEEIESIEYRPTESQEAYDSYIQAKLLADTVFDRWDRKTNLHEKAVGLDPNFVEAWAWLAHEYSHWWRYSNAYESEPDDQLAIKAQEALDEAMRLDSGHPVVLFAQGSIASNLRGDRAAKTRFLLEALEGDPSLKIARFLLAGMQRGSGRLIEAQHNFEMMVRADPLSMMVSSPLVTIYQERGMWDLAYGLIESNLKRVDEYEDFWRFRLSRTDYFKTGNKEALLASLGGIPGFTETTRGKTWLALQMNYYDRAIARIEEWLENQEEEQIFRRHGLVMNMDVTEIRPLELLLALVYFELGERDEWMIEAEKAKDSLELILKNNQNSDVSLARLTICYGLVGNEEKMNMTIARVRDLSKRPLIGTEYFNKARYECYFALAYFVLGDHEKAIETLEAASQMDSPYFLNRELDLWFIFDRLRGNPRFDALLED